MSVACESGVRRVWQARRMSHRYSKYLEGVDVMRSLEETPARIAALARARPPEAFERFGVAEDGCVNLEC